jgi:hypothetical protein
MLALKRRSGKESDLHVIADRKYEGYFGRKWNYGFESVAQRRPPWRGTLQYSM